MSDQTPEERAERIHGTPCFCAEIRDDIDDDSATCGTCLIAAGIAAAVLREREAWKKKLERYGSHDYDCEAESNPPDGEDFLSGFGPEPCTCGYEYALKGTKHEK